MTDLAQTVVDVVGAEISAFSTNELMAAVQRNALSAPEIGVMVPGSGCRFCLPASEDRDRVSEFNCDLKACVIHSLAANVLGILQDAELMFNMANIATARSRLASVLQTIFSKQKSEEIAARLLKTLEATA
ncbi:MAG TPA: hypothetical protein VEG65_06950 [Candidatus Bathyarchaeia archaeon]|nr:hypothetical protein [Candidatus Bathyarchaeia archaeon]